MELKATLAAEGDCLSSTAQVDKNNKHFPGFFVSPKTHHVKQWLMQQCHHCPLGATESLEVTMSR